jgi:polysaccharide pyruvyl transferase CsaB
MTNILIVGYYGLNNIGDEAILSGMITSIKKYIPDANFSVITNNPNTTWSLHKVNPVEHSFKKGLPSFFKRGFSNGEFINIYKAIDDCDIFILGGGALLQDLKFYYLPAMFSSLSLAKLKGKITVIYGIGAGPIDTQFGQLLTKRLLNNVNLVTVRDSMSQNVLENCGVDNVIQTIDPAFGIEVPITEDLKLADSRENIPVDSVISSTLYNWLHDSDIFCNPTKPNSDLQHRREVVASIYSEMIDKYDKDIMFIPTVNTDLEGYSQMNKLISIKNKSHVMNYKNDFNYIFSLFSTSDMLVGMRLHSLIFSTISGVPFVPISYCGKVKSYLELVGMDKFYLDVEDLCDSEFKDNFLTNFEDIFKNKGTYSKLLLGKANEFKQISLKNAKMVSELIR